jgi:hypothetical protein
MGFNIISTERVKLGLIFWIEGITERITEVIDFSDAWGGKWVGCEGQAAHPSATPPILTSGNHWRFHVKICN